MLGDLNARVGNEVIEGDGWTAWSARKKLVWRTITGDVYRAGVSGG